MKHRKHFALYVILAVVACALVLYSATKLPISFRAVTKNTNNTLRVTSIEPSTVTALEPSGVSDTLDNIPEINIKWNEVKELVEASESSVTAVEDVEDTDDVTVTYFDVPLNDELQSHIFEQCEVIGIDPAIVISMIDRESNFDSDIIGDNGRAFGLMQIHPKWHSDRMAELGCTDLLNPFDNVTVGIDILRELLERDISLEWALMAYNGGVKYANNLTAEGRVSEYANDVISGAEKLVREE